MKRSNWSLQQEERAGKQERNKQICWLVNTGDRGIQAYAACRYRLTRQRINQIYKRGKKKGFWKRLYQILRGQ